MAKALQKYQKELPRIKKNIQDSYDFNRANCKRFWEFKNFTFRTAISESERRILKRLGKPDIEFNYGSAYLSRLMGEFSKQEPSIEVEASEGVPPTQETVDTISAVDMHMRHILRKLNEDGGEWSIYKDQLGGGFSVIKMGTAYAANSGEAAFDQIITMDKAYDPTLCGFDPMARLPHKGDGRYWFELFPKTEEQFKEENPGVNIDDVKFVAEQEGFKWSYSADGIKKVLLVCDYYEKKTKKTKIIKLSNGKVVTEQGYKEILERHEELKLMEAAPVPIKERYADMDTICRYRIIENQVLEYKETDFTIPNLIFVDGDSEWLRKDENGPIEQFTRPFLYNQRGSQKLTNFAGQTMAGWMENIIQSKIMIAEESLPTQDSYMQALTDNQIPRVLVWKSQNAQNPDKPNPSPQPVEQQPMPPEIMAAFQAGVPTTQSILGSYDAGQGNISRNLLSGDAIEAGATQSNAAAMPYIVGFMHALNQAAQFIVSVIPKYYVTPRTIPVVTKTGERKSIQVNTPGKPSLQYEDNVLKVNVKAGVNFAIQQKQAIETMTGLMKISPDMNEFIGGPGLKMILENITMKGIDQLKLEVAKFQEEKQQMKNLQMEMAKQQMQNNPAVQKIQLEQAKLQHQIQQDAVKNQITVSQQSLDEFKAETDRLKLLLQEQENKLNAFISIEKSQAEKVRANVDAAVSIAHETHQQHSDMRDHDREDMRLMHDMKQANKPKPQGETNARA